VLYLDTFEPPVSAPALADQIGSTYQVAPTKGLSKRVPGVTLLTDELELDFTLEDDELTTELTTELALDLTLEELLTTELTTELATELELDLILEDELVATELEETPQPATTPNGAGCAAQVEVAIQLLPFS
jgi:hypothetical protein